MAKPVRLGIIGLGKFNSSHHVPNLLRLEDVEVAAVCDVSQERIDARNESLVGAEAFTDFEKLLDRDRLDGVLVSTNIAAHFDPCKLALERGIPVMVDKPMAKTARHAGELTELSQSKNVPMITAFTRHFLPAVEHVRQEIAAGALGELQMITAIQRRHQSRAYEVDGGMLLGRAVHMTDLFPWLTGKPIVGVEGRVERAETGHEQRVDVRLDLEGGLAARLICLKESGTYQDDVCVFGTEKSYLLESRAHLRIADRNGWQPISDLPDLGNATSRFVDLLRGAPITGPPTDPHSADGYRSLQVLEAIEEAGRTARYVEIPD